MTSSPGVARWELALRLRRRRLDLGIGASFITKALNVSAAYWSHIENERNLLPEGKLEQLLDILEIDEDERDELLALREAARTRGWWTRYSALFSDQLLRYYGLEWGARSIRTFESVLMPGLLQAEEYTRALMASATATVPAVEIEQRVAVRRQRKQRLDGDDPVMLSAVIGEAALMQQFGGAKVLYRQLRHLAETIRRHPDNVEVRVIPFTSPASVMGGSTFHLLDFDSPRLPTSAWHESAVFGELFTDDAERKETRVRDLAFLHDRAISVALDRSASLALIEERADHLESTM
ncbi:helix-turn-helix domain-containing protein [Nocardia cyriacigeorgica]|uniref:helix-turn-helix domain-containing protein n=1 Tax=Nocardia cyriacigeorgica TaxID=135487 RepID=UPI00245514B0|nr:helix-turn-helix transcriptional regulator [Nocardia cyriacigeorgica]